MLMDLIIKQSNTWKNNRVVWQTGRRAEFKILSIKLKSSENTLI